MKMKFEKKIKPPPTKTGIIATWIRNSVVSSNPQTPILNVSTNQTSHANDSIQPPRHTSAVSPNSNYSNTHINTRRHSAISNKHRILSQQIQQQQSQSQKRLSVSLSSTSSLLLLSQSSSLLLPEKSPEGLQKNLDDQYSFHKSIQPIQQQVLKQKIITFPGGSKLVSSNGNVSTLNTSSTSPQISTTYHHNNTSKHTNNTSKSSQDSVYLKSRPKRRSNSSLTATPINTDPIEMGNNVAVAQFTLSSSSSSNASLASSTCTTPQNTSEKAGANNDTSPGLPSIQKESSLPDSNSSFSSNSTPHHHNKASQPSTFHTGFAGTPLRTLHNNAMYNNNHTSLDCLSIRQLPTQNNSNATTNRAVGSFGCFSTSTNIHSSVSSLNTLGNSMSNFGNRLSRLQGGNVEKREYYPYPDPSAKAPRSFLTRLTEISILTQNTVRSERSKQKKNGNHTNSASTSQAPPFISGSNNSIKTGRMLFVK